MASPAEWRYPESAAAVYACDVLQRDLVRIIAKILRPGTGEALFLGKLWRTGTMAKTKRPALFACMECGKKFYTVKAAERAAFGAKGCPKCGGADIDVCTASATKGGN